MKKTKLQKSLTIDFKAVGISCTLKPYKLAWLLNKLFNLSLVKENDFMLNIGEENLEICNYLYETPAGFIKLIENKAANHERIGNLFLIPELKQFDFLLLIKESDSFNASEMIAKIKSLDEINFVIPIDYTQIKSKENLLF
ncbi:IPExxxVDY family protein [Marinigracilibium pacificum]|uniref:IPExxxVDY family protein n=1 Tax=Marinigracilibium pacificum TaxID=2729599 RepID=A0A848IZW3_9BACT|nr:IPExxxVDY family protein [Marinigracilibium pacificum]NMM49146.1 IPExxxVDY family protein [Marinigracilibium pacificum]